MLPHPAPHTTLHDAPNAESAEAKAARSSLVSRNVTISGHRTSVRLEPEMWSGLNEICRRERSTLHDTCSRVASDKGEMTSLTAAIRVFVMNYYRAAATDDGHLKVGHGLIGSIHNRDNHAASRNSRPPLRNVSAAGRSSTIASGSVSSPSGSLTTGSLNSGNVQNIGQGMGQDMTQAGQRTQPSAPFMIGMSRANGMR